MTTNITINASCGADKQVQVHTKTCCSGDVFTLLDGESREVVIYDDMEVSIKEVERTLPDAKDVS